MSAAPSWRGRLQLAYRRDGERTLCHDRHEGPLRVLQPLYPEGPGVCHHVLVHPPGGLAGGDELAVHLELAEAAQALVTTPGAARYYRSTGPLAAQRVHGRLADGARLEWLPLEAIAYPGCVVENHLCFELAPSAQMIGWDALALGLPASGQPFERGQVEQHLELPGVWLERGRIAGDDHRLLDGPLGLAGHRVLATLWFAGGAPLSGGQRDLLRDAAREAIRQAEEARQPVLAGCTAAHDHTVVLRALAHRVEPAMQLLQAVWLAWRQAAWQRGAVPPRVWRT